MCSNATCAFFLLFLVACINAAEITFTYEDQAAWNDLPGSVCNGSRQSPIDIPTSQLEDGDDFGLTRLVMTNWDVSTNGYWSNTGHTVQYIPTNVIATTQTYLGVYNLLQLHFHWGPNASVGSEHLVGGRRYSGELHFVHGEATATTNPGNKYTVVGVLLVEDSTMDISGTVWNTLATSNPAYNSTTAISGIVLNDMLPSNLSYYYYNGSLTTPLCIEAVQWVLLSNPVNVPAEFFARLRETPENANGTVFLEQNYRYVQPLNQRQVYYYSSAAPTSATALLLLVVMITLAFIQ